MRRRNLSEVQVAPSGPISADLDYNFGLLIPEYPEIDINDTYNTISANRSPSEANYSRDNYNIIPYKVPPMMFDGKVYNLDMNSLYNYIPTVGRSRYINFDKNIWTSESLVYGVNFWVNANYTTFSAITLTAFPGFVDILNASMVECTDTGDQRTCYRNTGYPDYKNNPDRYQCGPLDKVDTGYLGISEAFAYAWSDSWDINLMNRPVKYSKKIKKDESSSSGSESSGGTGGGALLCRIVSAPSSAGGTASVEVISVNAAGGISAGSSIVVNVPSI